MKYKLERVIKSQDWDKLVEQTYGRSYCLQQQEGCVPRPSLLRITVPAEDGWGYKNESIPEIINGPEMGVTFAAWLGRDPYQLLKPQEDEQDYYDKEFSRDLWWYRNFYPSPQVIANDLYKKGLLEAGKYIIEIDW